jgi:hypothetical protein
MARASSPKEVMQADELKRMLEAKGLRSPITGRADPFAEYSITDFSDEIRIIDEAGKVWKRQFCQAGARRGGGGWVSHDGTTAFAVVMPEKLQGVSTDLKHVNFWAEPLRELKQMSEYHNLPLVVLIDFRDGMFAMLLRPETALGPASIGSRLRKGPEYDGAMNLIYTFEIGSFKNILRREV